MSDELVIRFASASDLPEVVALWKVMMDYHFNLEPVFERSPEGHLFFQTFAKKHIEDDDKFLLIAKIGDDAAGFCEGEIRTNPPVLKNASYGYITDMVVAEKFRRQNVGTKLFQEAKKWFAEKGLDRIQLSVLIKNEISNPFWEKMGFAPMLEMKTMDI